MKNIIMLHDVDGKIYFQALEFLKEKGQVDNVEYYETRITKRLVKCFLRREGNYYDSVKRWMLNFKFRCMVPFISGRKIILGTAPYDFRFVWYGLLARKNEVIYHTSWPYWWTDNVPYKYSLFTVFLSKIFKYYLLNYKFKIVCVTEPVRQSISTIISDDSKTCVIPHCVDLSTFNYKAKIETKNNNGIEYIKVLYVGRVVKSKGVFEIISMARNLSKTHVFTIVGKGDDFEEVVNNAKDIENISFYGYVNDKKKLAKIFSEHDIFILPSKKNSTWEELFGLVIIEAMASGLLVISTDHIGPRGLINNGINGFLVSEEKMQENFEIILRSVKYQDVVKFRDTVINDVKKYNIDNVSVIWDRLFEQYFWLKDNKD